MPLSEQGRPRYRILYSLLLLLFAVGTVPLLWTSYTIVSDTRDRLELEQKQRQLATARSLSNQVALYVRSLEAHVRLIAQTIEVTGRARSFDDRQAELRSSHALERFVDPDGPLPLYYVGALSVAEGSCRGPGAGVPLPEQAIQRLMQEGCRLGRQAVPMISQPVMAASVREPIMVLSVPIASGDKSIAGVAVAVASLRPLWAMTGQMTTGGVEVYIVDDRGYLVAHSDADPARLEKSRDLSRVKIVEMFLASGGRASSTEPFVLETPQGPKRMLGTYARVPDNSGWGVIVQVSDADAYYAAYEARRRSMLLIALVSVVAIVLGTVFAGQLTRPIQELARGAQLLASGDYGTRVGIRSRNEVGFLAQAFNPLAPSPPQPNHQSMVTA